MNLNEDKPVLILPALPPIAEKNGSSMRKNACYDWLLKGAPTHEPKHTQDNAKVALPEQDSTRCVLFLHYKNPNGFSSFLPQNDEPEPQ